MIESHITIDHQFKIATDFVLLLLAVSSLSMVIIGIILIRDVIFTQKLIVRIQVLIISIGISFKLTIMLMFNGFKAEVHTVWTFILKAQA